MVGESEWTGKGTSIARENNAMWVGVKSDPSGKVGTFSGGREKRRAALPPVRPIIHTRPDHPCPLVSIPHSHQTDPTILML